MVVMSRTKLVRSSKVRHVYAETPKDKFCYKGLRLSTANGDHNYIKANTKYMAIPVAQAAGALGIFEMDTENRRLGPGLYPCLAGHKGPVMDFDFNPFQQQLIATGGDDCCVKVWGIPPEGLKDSVSDALADLTGHDKKVTTVLHHPSAEFVLATASPDKTVRIWDVEQQAEVINISHDDQPFGLAWDTNGETLATTCKDKCLRLIDPRSGGVREKVLVHDGSRASKVLFMQNKGPGNGEAICTVGFNRQSKRQFKLWDQRNLGKPFAMEGIDQSAGVMLPFYDEGTNMLYLAGKGDANIRYYELVDGEPWEFFIEEYRSTTPCRGICAVPKRIVDTNKCELMRFMKLCSNKVEPLSFICPRKNASSFFQADLYPDTFAGKAAIKAGDFFEGKRGNTVLTSMDPAKSGSAGAIGATASPTKAIKKKKSPFLLQKELDEANKKIEKYEQLLKSNNIPF